MVGQTKNLFLNKILLDLCVNGRCIVSEFCVSIGFSFIIFHFENMYFDDLSVLGRWWLMGSSCLR